MPHSELRTNTPDIIIRPTERRNVPFTFWEGIPVHRLLCEGENTIEVFAGTNAPMGGNVDHGARTVFVLNNTTKTCFESIRVIAQTDAPGDCKNGFVVVLGGDAEAATFADALDFAAKTIRRQLRENHAGQS